MAQLLTEASDKLIVICYLSSVLDDELCIPDATILIHFLTIRALSLINYGGKNGQPGATCLLYHLFLPALMSFLMVLESRFWGGALFSATAGLPTQIVGLVVVDCRTLRDEAE